jgi:hypothetical protein
VLALLGVLVLVVSCSHGGAEPREPSTEEGASGIVDLPAISDSADATGSPTGTLPFTSEDEACVRRLAQCIGLSAIDSVRSRSEPRPVGDDSCSVDELAESLGDDRERWRSATIVRTGNTHYDWYHPETWITDCGWKASPEMVSTWVVQSVEWVAVTHRLSITGDDPTAADEVRDAFAVVADAWRPADPDGGRPTSSEALARIGALKRPASTYDFILPAVAGHQGAGHRLAAFWAERDAYGGNELFVCFEATGVAWVGDLPFYTSPSQHRCEPAGD